MDFEEVKKYWEERAAADSSAQSTTQDFYMREIEFKVVSKLIELHKPASVMDAGCGDARTTARLAARFEALTFTGGDYSESMVKNARRNIDLAAIRNLNVVLCDVSQPLPVPQQDMIYSTRCLINLPTWELQQQAIRNIGNALAPGGVYVMVENFVEGHDNLNRVRRDFGLPAIAVRPHNLFFGLEELREFVSDSFTLLEEVNISSTYYLVSRTIYSKICQEKGTVPDYFDEHHKYAAELPFCGEFGPVRMVCMKKK